MTPTDWAAEQFEQPSSFDIFTWAPDIKTDQWISPYIEEYFWNNKNHKSIIEAVKILDDPLLTIGNDTLKFKETLKKLLPELKDVHIQLKDHITPSLLDRLIIHQINLYLHQKQMSWLLTQVLQQWPEKEYIESNKPYELSVQQVPETQKNIIARIFIYMIAEKNFNKSHKKN